MVPSGKQKRRSAQQEHVFRDNLMHSEGVLKFKALPERDA